MKVEDRIKEYLDYDQETGIIKWKKPPPRKGFLLNQPAGAIRPDGYITIKFEGTSYLAHRLAWFIKTGEWPTKIIDHFDRNRSNNKWQNLRLASNIQNCKNRNNANVVGVCRYARGGWQVYFRAQWVGRFDLFCAAVKARRKIEAAHGTSF